MATAGGTPAWATSGSEFSGVPDDPTDFKEFCYIVASRYRGRIHAWGFWNEPNLDHFWEGGRSQYTNEILIPGIEAVGRADPDTLMVGPDLAHLQSADWDDWLEDIVSDTRQLLDVVTHHVYPSDGSAGNVTEKLNEGGDFPWEPPSVRSVLEDAGWRGRPVWLTETGVESDVVGEAGQEDFYLDVLEDWFGPDRNNSWISRIFFYEIVDPGNDPSLSWGILESPPGLEPKLAYHAYSSFIEDSEVDDAEIRIHGLPRFMGSNDVAPLSFAVTNTGTTTWFAVEGYYLIFDVEALGWVHDVEPIAVTDPVLPGETVILEAVLRSPFTSVAYPPDPVSIAVRMTKIGSWRFGDGPHPTVIHTAHEPATVVVQPVPSVSHFNGRAAFGIEVESETDTTYQWRRNTVPLEDDHHYAGTDATELAITGIGFDSLGDYDCVVTNAAGSVVSETASLATIGSPIRRPTGRWGEPTTSLLQRWLDFIAGRPGPNQPAGRHDRVDSSRATP
jgi:hypothetical protein